MILKSIRTKGKFALQINMIFAKPILAQANKKASDFISWLCDGTRNHGLEKYKGENLIRIDSNNGSGGKIYIDERLESKLNEFINK